MIKRFTYAEFVNMPLANKPFGAGKRSWDNGLGWNKTVEYSRKGDMSMVTAAEVELDKLSLSTGEGERLSYVPAVAGQRVCVPDYLSGSPTAFRKRTKRASTVLHVDIYVFNVSSAGIGASTLLKRGLTILALMQALQARNISTGIFLVTDLDGRTDDGDITTVIELETKPLDLSLSGFAIAHPAFARNLTYSYAENFGFAGGWSATYEKCGGHREADKGYKKYISAMRTKLGAAASDVFIPPVSLYDTLVTDPERWLQERLDQLAG